MDKSDSVRKLISILEPLIGDLDENKKSLSDRKDEMESVSRLIAYTKDNIETVGIYADQDLITNTLEKINYSVDDYKASCYLLKSESESVKKLPQYEKAFNLISDIIEYFKLHKAELTVEIQDLNNICHEKEIEKKYYDLLTSTNPLVEDVDEFKTLLTSHGLSDEEIIDILFDVIKGNVKNYKE